MNCFFKRVCLTDYLNENDDVNFSDEKQIKKRAQECCSLFSYKLGRCCCKWLNDESTFSAKLSKQFSEGVDEVETYK